MKNVFTVLVVLFISQSFIAQNYKFGKVSIEELQEKNHPLDSSANAAYLYKYRKTSFEYQQEKGFQLVTEIHERIKIYNQEGFDYATKSISLYKSNSNKEKVNTIKAYTYNLVDDKIEDTKLKKDGIFKTELSKYYDETKFTMPNIKEGCVIEYEYRIVSPFYQNVDEFRFQHDIPIKNLKAKFVVPEYFVFNPRVKGFLSISPTIKGGKGRLIYKNKISLNESRGSRQTYNKGEVEYSKKEYFYNLSNVVALKNEPYVNNIDNYRSSVKYELSFTKFPESQEEYFSATWEDVVKSIYRSYSFGEELNKTGYFEKDIDALIASVSDPKRRVALIYNFVKHKVKWNRYHGIFTNQGVRKAYKEQVGNVAEINLMLTSMLRYAGIEANPVLVSTRNHGVPLFPTRDGYNYVISCVEFPTGYVLLDATSLYGSPNILPKKLLNWKGRVVKKGGTSTTVNLYPNDNSKTTILMAANLKENGDINGSYRSSKTNHSALSYRERYINADKDDYLEKLENSLGGIEITDFKVTNAKELSKPVLESYKFVKESQADVIGDKIYFSPLFFLRTTENPFKLEKREFPVDFGYPASNNYRITVNLPEGYNVESIPEAKVVTLPDNLGAFKYVISQKESSIQVSVNTKMNESIVSPLYYETLKEYFKQMIEKQNEQIVLTKS